MIESAMLLPGDTWTKEVEAIGRRVHAHVNGDELPSLIEPRGEVDSPIDTICGVLDLSSFERRVLLLCVACELDSHIADLCQRRHGHRYPTFGLASAVLPQADVRSLARDAPLRRWALLESNLKGVYSAAPLVMTESALHRVLGWHVLDAAVADRVRVLTTCPIDTLSTGHRTTALEIATALASNTTRLPQVFVRGRRHHVEEVVSGVCETLGLRPFVMSATDIPERPDLRSELLAAWNQEVWLGGAALLIETWGGEEPRQHERLAAFTRRLDGAVFLTGGGSPDLGDLTYELPPMTTEERLELWRDALRMTDLAPPPGLPRLAATFDLPRASIDACCLAAVAAPHGDLATTLWEGCRRQSRPPLEQLCHRVLSETTLHDLVVSPSVSKSLQGVVAHVRHSTTVHDTWALGSRTSRGRGVTAVFAGPSGTGKTFAAEAIANTLGLDLFRVDLSAVLSKYIGETEKKLRRVFDAAHQSGAVLLFDEADVLFGKRTEIREGRDRYANAEVGFLLQEMEAYDGLAILTTNLVETLDTAFLRRLRFVVTFEFPDAAERQAIWRRIYPAQTPTTGLDYPRLGQLSVTGGQIRNIALQAAFWAADQGESVGMRHIRYGAELEYAKHHRSVSHAEIEGWPR